MLVEQHGGSMPVYDICRLQTADRIDKENSINSNDIINKKTSTTII